MLTVKLHVIWVLNTLHILPMDVFIYPHVGSEVILNMYVCLRTSMCFIAELFLVAARLECLFSQ